MGQTEEQRLDHNYLSQLSALNLTKARTQFEQFQEKEPKLSLSARFQQKQEQKTLTQNILRIIAQKAVWLTKNQQETVADEVWLIYQKKAVDTEQALKLLAILLAIPYAEEMQDRHGTLNNFIYERILNFKETLRKQGLPSSYTPWQIPITHINTLIERELQDKSQEEIIKIGQQRKKELFQSLATTQKAVETVLKIIILNIGIKKKAKRIFAQYNHKNQHCTEIAALQVYLNLLRCYAQSIIKSLEEKEKTSSLEKFIEEALTSSNNKAIEIRTKNRFPIALDKEDKLRLLEKAKQCEYAKEKDLDSLKDIITKWPECDVDGDTGKQVKDALAAANSFFNLELDFDKNKIKEFLELEKVLKQLKIDQIECMPTHSTISKEELEAQLNRILEESKNIKKRIIGKIKLELTPVLKRKNIESVNLLNYFRRNLFQNPGNTHDYVDWAMQAYNSIMASIGR